MSRGLTAAQKSYTGPKCWLAGFTTRAGATHFFTSLGQQHTVGGNLCLPYLNVTEGPREFRALRPIEAGIDLLGGQQIVDLLDAESFEGALVILKEYFIGLDFAYDYRLQASGVQDAEDGVSLTLRSAFEPARVVLPAVDYSQLCPWRFDKKRCGHDAANISFVENLAEKTATSGTSATITDTTLSEAVNVHRGRALLLTAGTGKGQAGYILSNTTDTFTLAGEWPTVPDATTKFKVFTFTNGAPKALFTSTSAKLETTASAGAATFIEDTVNLAMTVDEHTGELVRITAGTGSGQQRKIGTNTATRINLAAGETGFNPVPGATSVFRVIHRLCPKTMEACEQRGRTPAFGGFVHITPELHKIAAGLSRRFNGGTEDGSGRGEGDIPLVEAF